MGKSVKDYALPAFVAKIIDTTILDKREVMDELSITTPNSDKDIVHLLNPSQHATYDIILQHVMEKKGKSFSYMDLGELGKHFYIVLYLQP